MESLLVWIVGILTGMAVLKIYQGMKDNKLVLKWYHWLIGVLWYAMGLFIMLFITTSFYEKEPQAAGMAILIFGGVFLVITILLYRFVYGKKVKNSINESVA